MKQRISNLKITNTADGKIVYASALPSPLKSDLSDLIISADEITRLDLLAHKYLGDRDLWWMIASVNGITNGSMHVLPGAQILIPLSERRNI